MTANEARLEALQDCLDIAQAGVAYAPNTDAEAAYRTIRNEIYRLILAAEEMLSNESIKPPESRMNKPLKRIQAKCWYFVDGKKIGGTHAQLSGDVTGLSGDVTAIPIDARAKRPDVAYWTQDDDLVEST